VEANEVIRTALLSCLVASAAHAQLDGGAAGPPLTEKNYRTHPFIVAVRAAVADIDARVTPAATEWRCATRGRGKAPANFAGLQKALLKDPTGPQVELVELERATGSGVARDRWKFQMRNEAEVSTHQSIEVTRHSRRQLGVFLYYREDFAGVGAYSLEVRAWGGDDGKPSWFATRYSSASKAREAAGRALPALPDGTDAPPVDQETLLAWLDPEKAYAAMRPCDAAQVKRLRELAESHEWKKSDLELARATWVPRE
jgi:hypothetical protein